MATAVATTEPDAPDARRSAVAARLARLIVALPDRLMTWFLAASVVVALALLVDQFRPALVFPAVALGVILTSRFVPQAPQVNRSAVAGAGAALLLAMTWYMMQRGHTAEMVGLDRDPSQYTLSALYLMSHPSPDVALDPALPGLAANVPGVLTDLLKGGGGAVNYVQGNGLLPGLLAIFGWVHGTAGVLTGNVAIGALALLSVYAISRRILGPLWGLAPMVLLAVTIPLAAFSRMPYTEPTALIFVCGMLVALWVALETRNQRLFALAGVFAGATMVARIDGGLIMIAGLASLALVAVAPVSPVRRSEGRLAMLIFTWGAAPMAALGWLGLYIHSPKYLSDLSRDLNPLLAAMPVVLMLGLGLSAARSITGPVARWLAGHRRGLAIGAGIVVGLACLAMATRPWWMERHFIVNQNDLDYVGAVAARQKQEGLPIDGTKSYDEMTVTWLAWYLGWALIVAALAGATMAAVRFCRRRDPKLLVMWAIPSLVGLAYLNKVAITPDQIWAMRRLLPVIIPMTAISAVFAIRAVVMNTRFRTVRAAGVLITAGLVLYPATYWGPLFDSREGIGTYDLVMRICQLAGPGLIVQAGPYPIMGSAMPALQQLCSNKVVSLNQPTPASMAQIKENWKGAGPITVVAFFPDAVTWSTPIDPQKPLAKAVFSRWESVIAHRPAKLNLQQVSVWMGTPNSAGLVTPFGAMPFPALSSGS